MRGQTITLLLVEDDDVDAEAIERGLHKHHIANPLRRAKDGVEALHILQNAGNAESITPPYLLLVDINMPRLDGIGLIRQLRKDPHLQKSIVFVLTTSKSEEDKCAAYKLNVAGYILKSRVGEDFLQMVNLLDHYWKIVEFPPQASVSC